MSDLISRSALLDDMLKELEKAINNEDIKEFDCKVLMTIALVLKSFVDRQPTAYNVDKVVAELEKLPTKGINRYKGGSFGNYEGTDYFIDQYKAIEIVRKGGVE